MKKEIPDVVMEILNQKFKLLDHLSFLEFDHDFDVLRSRLSICFKQYYPPNEKILVEHFDTDYYIKECKVGINLRNFFGVIEELGISPSTFIIYTNHFGISQEIDLICSEGFHVKDRPTVIESFLSILHHDPGSIIDIPADFERIQFQGLCMMHMKRTHRHAVFNSIKSVDPTRLILSATLFDNANF